MNSISTPLRYPGGKYRIWKQVAELIRLNQPVDCEYAEPYAGGAGVAIQLLMSGIVKRIHINDINPALGAFWRSVLTNPDELCTAIEDCPISVQEWDRQKAILRSPSASDVERGFAFLYLNRTNFSGVINGGIIGGRRQEGKYKMDARFPKQRIVRLIKKISSRRDNISLTHLDAGDFIRNTVPSISNCFLYCDPPYYVKGRDLYMDFYEHNDHERIAALLQKLDNIPWIVSYDNVEKIQKLYENCEQIAFHLQYSVRTKQQGSELFIFSPGLKLPPHFLQSHMQHFS